MINNYFNKVICINLNTRKDRWREAQHEFSKANIKVERYAAIENNPMGWNHIKSDNPLDYIKPLSWPGAAGCMASHVNIWKMAKENGWKNVLIIEDDCDFVSDLQEMFTTQIQKVPTDWDLLYFGGIHETRKGLFNPVKIAENVLKCKRLITTTCYAIKDTCYDLAIDTILENEPDFYTAVDTYLASRVQPKTNSYCFHPPLAWQRGSYSNVQNGNRDYSKLMKEDNIKK